MATNPPAINIIITTESFGPLGHFSRVRGIIDAIKEECEERGVEPNIHIISGSLEFAQGKIDFSDRHVYTHALPKVTFRTIEHPELTEEGTIYSDDTHFQARRAAAVKSVIEAHPPHIVIAELHPAMMRFRDDDIRAIKELASTLPYPPTYVTIQRDITPLSPEYAATSVDVTNRYMDHVLVVGDPNIARLHDVTSVWDQLANTRYMGYAVNLPPPPSRSIEMAEREILVQAGGGFDELNYNIFVAAIESRALSTLASQQPWAILVGSPTPPERFQALQALAHNAAPDGKITIEYIGGGNDYRDRLAHAAGHITKGGYNSTLESIAAGIPPVITAVENPEEEGYIRAQLFTNKGVAAKLILHGTTPPSPQQMAQALDHSIALQTNLPALDFNGAKNIAHFIIEQALQQTLPSPQVEDSTYTGCPTSRFRA